VTTVDALFTIESGSEAAIGFMIPRKRAIDRGALPEGAQPLLPVSTTVAFRPATGMGKRPYDEIPVTGNRPFSIIDNRMKCLPHEGILNSRKIRLQCGQITQQNGDFSTVVLSGRNGELTWTSCPCSADQPLMRNWRSLDYR
jgi:hypothetical protein